jgi:hypothetical protein
MKLIKNAVMCIILLSMVSCSKDTKLTMADTIGKGLSAAIITTASCQNTDLVKSDVQGAVDTWFNVNREEAEKGAIADVCKLVVAKVVPNLIGLTLKKEWDCKLTTIEGGATLLANLVCPMIPI